MGNEREWDAFISHASEDKTDFAEPLAEFRSTIIRQIYDIATIFDERIGWPSAFSREDLLMIRLLHEAVTTGRTSISPEEIQITVNITPGVDADTLLQQTGEMLATPPDPPEFATVLGKTFPVGPYGIHIKPRELSVSQPEGKLDVRVVKIQLAAPLIYEFTQFASAAAAATGDSRC
jgi:hypothetical protein